MKNLFFIFSILTFAKSTKMYEFFEYTLDPGSLLEINDLQNHFILVSFFQANPFALDVKYYDADDKKESLKFKTKETYLFKCSRITFFTNEINQKITMWKILDSFCNSSAVLMRTENLIEAVTENNIQQFPLCIFTQLEGDHFYVSTSTKPISTISPTFFRAIFPLTPLTSTASKRCKPTPSTRSCRLPTPPTHSCANMPKRGNTRSMCLTKTWPTTSYSIRR